MNYVKKAAAQGTIRVLTYASREETTTMVIWDEDRRPIATQVVLSGSWRAVRSTSNETQAFMIRVFAATNRGQASTPNQWEIGEIGEIFPPSSGLYVEEKRALDASSSFSVYA